MRNLATWEIMVLLKHSAIEILDSIDTGCKWEDLFSQINQIVEYKEMLEKEITKHD